ncbi:MAG: YacL family protein [Psychromonas sp.]|nr:YacL family protein [Psychromonas sp.]
MEFEFRKDFISEQATVKLSMGHEAFATWLEQEGQAIDWIEALLDKLLLLQQRQIPDFKLEGSEFLLLVNQDEAQVINHSLMNNQEEPDLENNMDFYDAEIQASCGLEDFLNLIESWLEFVHRR